MVRSDWSKKWTTDAVKAKALAADPVFPGVSLDAIKFLHLKRHILFHGHEPLDTDTTPTLEGEAWLMHHGYTQAEGVDNLEQVPETGCLLNIGYPKFGGGLGGYARYIAICPPVDQGRHEDLARRRAAEEVQQAAALRRRRPACASAERSATGRRRPGGARRTARRRARDVRREARELLDDHPAAVAGDHALGLGQGVGGEHGEVARFGAHLRVLVRGELDRGAAGDQAALAAVGRRLAEVPERGQPVVEPAPPHLSLSDKFEGAVGR